LRDGFSAMEACLLQAGNLKAYDTSNRCKIASPKNGAGSTSQ